MDMPERGRWRIVSPCMDDRLNPALPRAANRPRKPDDPPLRDKPEPPIHDPPADPTHEPDQPFGDPTPLPGNDPPDPPMKV
jgi:hypothetical protein